MANAAGFQLVWFACVAGAGLGLAWAGPVATLVFAGLTLVYAGRRSEDLRMVALLVPLGFTLDSCFSASGVLAYRGDWALSALAPAWIACLWIGFALTLNHSLAFLRTRPLVALGFGLVGAPLSYWTAASAFKAVTFPSPAIVSLALLAASWAVLLPLVFALSRSGLDRVRALP